MAIRRRIPGARRYHLRPSPKYRLKTVVPIHLTMDMPIRVPDKLDLSKDVFQGTRDQGEEGACSGFSTAAFREILWGLSHKASLSDRLSPAYLYARTRIAEGTWPDDAGATLADEFAILNNFGVCPESDMPYDCDPAEQIPNIADAAAHSFRCGTPATIDMGDPQKGMLVLASGLPFAIGISVYESFESPAADGSVPIPDTSRESLLGGHALCCVGYDQARHAWRIANSWGPHWGDCGFCWMPMTGYPIFEAWTAVDR